jgi:hypothetical protein
MPMTRDSHNAHDPYLIAQLAADDLAGTERAAAERLVARCERCRELHTDLTTILAATADLPAPRRTRDFRLTEADAARLRSPWRRWFGPLAKPRFAFVQPIGAALATLGLAGLLVGILPNLAVTSSAPAAAPAPVSGTTAPVEAAPSDTKSAPSPAASSAFAQSVPGETPRDDATAAPIAAPSAGQPVPLPTAAPSTEPVRITSATAAPANASAAPSGSNDAIAAPPATSVPPVVLAPVATAAGGAADSAPASDGSGGTSIQTGPANVGAGPIAGPTAAPTGAPTAAAPSEAFTAPSVAPTPARGITTGINPGRSPNPTPVADVPTAPSTTAVNGLIVLSGAALVIGLLLLVVRLTAVRATR